MSGWEIALGVYVVCVLGTLWPIARTFWRKVELYPGGPSFDDSPHFTDDGKRQLNQNAGRIAGTLVFWKNMAERYKRFHYYSLIWITISTVALPFLTQLVSTDPWSKSFLTAVSAFAALLLALSRSIRVEAHYRAFREGESEYYDLYRRMLDRPKSLGATEQEQIDTYTERVEQIRKIVRAAETENLPSVDDFVKNTKTSRDAIGG